MEYIVNLYDRLTKSCRQSLDKIGALVTYESKYVPVIGIKTNESFDGSCFDFIREFRKPHEGYFNGEFTGSPVAFMPALSEKPLITSHMTGWGIKIAILDSGVNDINLGIAGHKDFTGTGTKDIQNHGTIVAHVIKNFARGSLVYSVKIGNQKPDELNMMKGLEWAIENGMNVVNISSSFKRDPLCIGECDLCKLVNIASKEGISVVVAAGNAGPDENTIYCPGQATDSITVGAINPNNEIAHFSSIGNLSNSKPNIVAPGYCYVDGVPYSGTSFAAPIVTGIIGAISASASDISGAINHIYNTARDLGLPSHHQGHGCVDVDKIVGVVKNEKINCKTKGQEIG